MPDENREDFAFDARPIPIARSPATDPVVAARLLAVISIIAGAALSGWFMRGEYPADIRLFFLQEMFWLSMISFVFLALAALMSERSPAGCVAAGAGLFAVAGLGVLLAASSPWATGGILSRLGIFMILITQWGFAGATFLTAAGLRWFARKSAHPAPRTES